MAWRRWLILSSGRQHQRQVFCSATVEAPLGPFSSIRFTVHLHNRGCERQWQDNRPVNLPGLRELQHQFLVRFFERWPLEHHHPINTLSRFKTPRTHPELGDSNRLGLDLFTLTAMPLLAAQLDLRWK